MTQSDLEKMTFEQALTALEGLVRRLEEGRLPLEEAIAAYEQGAALRKFCEEKLKAAQLKVDQILTVREGVPETQPFSEG